MPTDEFVFSQGTFLPLFQKLGYIEDPQGVCFGIAHMGVQAMLAGDLEHFNQRIKLISSMLPKNIDTLELKSDEAKKAIIQFQDRIEKAKQHIVSLRKNAKETKSSTENTQSSKESLLIKKVEDKINQCESLESIEKDLSEEELIYLDRLILEIGVFFEGVTVYQVTTKKQELFENTPLEQTSHPALQLLSPTYFDKNPLIAMKEERFSGIYQKNELSESYFKALREAWKKYSPNGAFTLGSSNHSISIRYDPQKDCWYFIDANSLPALTLKNDAEIADQVLNAFSKNGITTFHTDPYTTATDESKMKAMMNEWKNNTTWEKMHKVTQEKALQSDSCGGTWLFTSARIGDTRTVESLIKNGAELFKRNEQNYSPMGYAMRSHHEVRDVLWAAVNKEFSEEEKNNDDTRSKYIVSLHAQLEERNKRQKEILDAINKANVYSKSMLDILDRYEKMPNEVCPMTRQEINSFKNQANNQRREIIRYNTILLSKLYDQQNQTFNDFL